MTVYPTPDPIAVSVEFGIGDLHLVASDVTETVVEVGPTDATNDGDVNAAEQTRVEFASGSLIVRGPKLAAADAVGAIGWSRVDRRRDPAPRGLTGVRGRGAGVRARHRSPRRARPQDRSG